MIHYIIPCENTDIYKTTLEPSLNKYCKLNNNVYLEEGIDRSIFTKYNDSLNRIPNIKDEDVVVFLHDDTTIRDSFFEQKLDMYFKIKTKTGMAGVIGTTEMGEGSGWWLTNRETKTRGRIIQGFKDGSEHLMAEPSGMDDTNIVSVDGCMMFMRGSVAQKFRFDEDTYTGYHFYDVDSCFSLIEQGWNIGIIDVSIKHESEGPLTKSWHENRVNFINKWQKKGYHFPITKKHLVEKRK